jgi:Membrane protein implicated in regulation of membrane protease activity
MEYVTMNIFWVVIIVLAIVVEALSTQLLSIWFVGGGIVGLICNALGMSSSVQCLIAFSATLLLLFGTRPFIKKKLKVQYVETNSGRYVGEEGLVLEDIDNVSGRGQVKVKGSIWSARSENDVQIPKDSRVTVLRIEGVKLIVKLAEAL